MNYFTGTGIAWLTVAAIWTTVAGLNRQRLAWATAATFAVGGAGMLALGIRASHARH